MAARRSMSTFSGRFILPGVVIGPKATASKLRKCPSQPSFGVHATLSNVGARNAMVFSPTAFGRPSPQDSAGLWQVAQDRVFDPERIGSQNSKRPSLALAS